MKSIGPDELHLMHAIQPTLRDRPIVHVNLEIELPLEAWKQLERWAEEWNRSYSDVIAAMLLRAGAEIISSR